MWVLFIEVSFQVEIKKRLCVEVTNSDWSAKSVSLGVPTSDNSDLEYVICF